MKDLMKEFYGSGPNIQPLQKNRKAKLTIAEAINAPQTMVKDMPVAPVVTLYGDVGTTLVSQRAEDLWRK